MHFRWSTRTHPDTKLQNSVTFLVLKIVHQRFGGHFLRIYFSITVPDCKYGTFFFCYFTSTQWCITSDTQVNTRFLEQVQDSQGRWRGTWCIRGTYSQATLPNSAWKSRWRHSDALEHMHSIRKCILFAPFCVI